jgi:TonB-dependent starch-binding outer membrane protein SusC
MKFSNTLKRAGLLSALLVLFVGVLSAQRTVKGKVTDADNGEALIGATVTVVGTTRGAVTDIDGNYSVEVPAGATQLRFAYTGYAEQVVDLSSSNVVEIGMKPNTVLDEVVVVGYGTLKSREVTGSVATIKAGDFNKGNIVDPAQLLQGKVAGLTITRPGGDPNGNFAIRLRGLSTLGQNTQPLIVIDGVPGLPLNSVDPNDIESFDVLKDASAAAIYGTRAAAGVIIITTKKGQAGTSTANYNAQLSVDQIERRINVLNADDFTRLTGNASLGANNNWLDEITQTGLSQTHSLNMSGGSNKTTYRTTLSYRNNKGIARTTGFEQYIASLSVQQKVLNDRLTLTANANIFNRDADLGFSEAFRYATIYNPTAPILNADGSYYEIGGFEQFNPVAIIEQNTNERRTTNYTGSLRGDLQITKDLTFSMFGSRFAQFGKGAEFYSRKALYRSGNRGLARAEENFNDNNLLESTIGYNKTFGKVDFKALAGYGYQDFNETFWINEAANVAVDNFGIDNFNAYEQFRQGQAFVASDRTTQTIISQFGRINLGYDNLVYVSAALRRDGVSRFGKDSKWGLFPSVSGGIALDRFLEGTPVSSLKLRAGYGVSGNSPRISYQSLSKVAPNGQSAFYGGAYLPGWTPTGANANPDLSWERKADINVGTDFSLFDYKLSGSLEYYRSTVSDFLFDIPVAQPPYVAGNTFSNVGTLVASGIELAANYQVNDNWSTSVAATRYFPSRLTDFFRNFVSQEFGNVGAPGQNSVNYTVVSIEEGNNEIGNFVALKVARLGEDGKYVYLDKDGNETTDKGQAARGVVGNGLPKYEIGWTNTFNFGRFDLQLFLRGMFGHSLAHEFRAFYETLGDNNGWNKVETKYFDENNKENNAYNSRIIEKGDFLRIENLTIGYTFPMPSGSWVKSSRVFFNTQQLFTFTGYSGVDPTPRLLDTGSVDNGGRAPVYQSPLVPGVDRRNTYFTTRTYNFGVSFGF